MTRYLRKGTQYMAQFRSRGLMARIPFASTAAKLWWLFLHSKSTLIRDFPPRETSQKPRVTSTCLHHLLTFLRAKYGLRCLLPKWSRCSGYSNRTGDSHQKTDHSTFRHLLVFIVSASLSRLNSWRAQSFSICKNSWPKFKVSHLSRLCQSCASSCRLVPSSLTPIPQN